VGRLAAPTARQYGAWSTSGPWPVVDELQPQVICSCGLASRRTVTWVFGSRQFSSLHVVSGAHALDVPCHGR
jgi:hypothetical protein